MSVNKAILIGYVGNDPEVKYLENSTPVANFRLATSESYTNRSGEKVTTTEWHNIVLWRGLAEIAEKYVKKGSQIYIEGRIRTRAWEDRDKNKRYTTEIIADSMQMMGRRSDGSPDTSPAQASTNERTPSPKSPEEPLADNGETDDLPF
jgi:single-strand DNA-binding protein